MLLPIPVVGIDPGPDWANNINNCLTIIDGHNHTTGEGVQIPTDGLNINADLTFNGFNAIDVRSVRFDPQGSPLALPSDLGCVYVAGVDLYYNDTNGNQVRMTQGGSVAGTPGSITGLVPPAAVTYTPPDQTFTFTSAPLTPANLDAGYINLRNFVLNSKALTLQAPPAMAADYMVTLPPLPASTKILRMTSSGVMTADLATDNTTINVTANELVVQASGLINGVGLQAVGNKIELTAAIASNRTFTANGLYSSAASFPQTEVDGLFFFPFDATITSVWIFNRTPGPANVTELDLLRATTSGGAFTSILSTTGEFGNLAPTDAWTDSNTVIAPQVQVQKPALSITNVNAGDAIRMDILQSMTAPAADCGMVVYYIPR